MSPLDTHADISVRLGGRELLPNGTRLELIALTLTGPPWIDEHSPPPVPPAGMLLRPEQARQLAAELVELADRATTTPHEVGA